MSPSRLSCLAAFVMLLPSPSLALPPALPRGDDPAVRVFLSNELEEALPLLRKSAKQAPKDADAHAWLASCERRLGAVGEAERSARRALALDPCNAFAHSVLADAFDPGYSEWEHVDAESSWAHHVLAIRCDPGSGDSWAGVWIQAMQRGEADFERRALVAMPSSGFLTPGLLAYGRWVLRSLPDRAAILCNGDMDTYPLVALQETEGLRRDVAVLNAGLLELPWYRRLMHERHGVPLPAEEELAPTTLADGTALTSNQRLLVAWLDSLTVDRFGRPFTTATTLDEAMFPSGTVRHDVLAGPFWIHPPGATGPGGARVDTVLTLASFAYLDRPAASTTYVSERDHSPLRRKYTDMLHDNIASVAQMYVAQVLQSGDEARAWAALAWAQQVARETSASAEMIRSLQPRTPDDAAKQ